MEMDLIWLAVGIAVAGYFIGDGLRNFKTAKSKSMMDYLEEDDEHELIEAENVHHFINISKEDAFRLVEEHKDIPHIVINDKVYYPKAALREWLLHVGRRNV